MHVVSCRTGSGKRSEAVAAVTFPLLQGWMEEEDDEEGEENVIEI